MPAPPMASPSTTYSGPPPPYSYPSSASSSVVGGINGAPGGHSAGSFSSSQGRPHIGDDKDSAHHASSHPSKQTLPPITEALSINSMLNADAPPKTPRTAPSPTSPTYRYDSDSASRHKIESYQQASTREAHPYETQRPSMNSFSPTHTNSNSHPITNNYNHVPTSQPLQTPRTFPDISSYSRTAVSTLPQQSQVSPITINPPTSRPEPTSQPTPTYPYQAPFSYPPSTPLFDNWRNGVKSEQERAEEIRKAIPKDSPPNRHPYGEQVKRHLDIFDLETALNEVS